MANGFVSRWKGKIYAIGASLFQFGAGGGAFGASGNLVAQAFGSASGIQPTTTNQDIVLAAYTLPANSFDKVGRMITISGFGSFANNTNAKRVKVIYNPNSAVVGSSIGTSGTVIADTSSFASGGAVFGWSLVANVAKSTGASKQVAQQIAANAGAFVLGLGAPVNTTANEAASIVIALTGNAATATGDIVMTGFEITAAN